MTDAPRELTAAHWGTYELVRDAGAAGAPGVVSALSPLAEDPDPSPIGLAMLQAYRQGPRVQAPAVRRSWLEHGPGAHPDRRGREPFVEVSWDEAITLVAQELQRVRRDHGNDALFGGSYGWSSAGRFHHAQGQLHRFLNCIGGYVRHNDSYSLGAGRVVMPHVVDTMDNLMASHTDWQTLADHTRLFVSFGGVPRKNAQVGAGGASVHHVHSGLQRLAAAGCRFVNFSPVRSDLDVPSAQMQWWPIRPGSDVAVMLALATEIILAGRHDREFLQQHCSGFERWETYLLGREDGTPKTAEWAARLSGLDAQRLRDLALDMAQAPGGRRTLVNVAWSLQRADHGEQAFWATVGLAAVIGHIGLPGGGFGCAYGSVNVMGSDSPRLPGPTLPQGRNPVTAFIPCARIADLLLHPGETFDYNGGRHVYPDIKLVYWAGGNPFHHHQDLNRLLRAWHRPQTIVVHEQVWNAHAKLADIVLPATTTLEREDIGSSTRNPLFVAMRQVDRPPGQARDDHAIFSDLAAALGAGEAFTLGRSPREWLRALWEEWRVAMQPLGLAEPPDFDTFWRAGQWWVPDSARRPVVLLSGFREDPQRHALRTPTGRLELYSPTVGGFGLEDCPGYPAWREPAEWLGAPQAQRWPLHLISDQPVTQLHSQLDFSSWSQSHKVGGRSPVWMHPDDALARGIADGDAVELFNERGACLAGAVLTQDIRPGVLKLSTGAWWDPLEPGVPGSLDLHGNPNVLTRDVGASRLSQGCSAQTCLVEVRKALNPPAPRPYSMPDLVTSQTKTKFF